MTPTGDPTETAPAPAGTPPPPGPPDEQVLALSAHIDAGRFDLIEQTARRMTEQWPDYPLGWKMLGIVAAVGDDLGQAKTAFGKYRSLMMAQGEFDEAFQFLNDFGKSMDNQDKLRQAALTYQELGQLHISGIWEDWGERQLRDEGISVMRLQHDIEQVAYLIETGCDAPGLEAVLGALTAVYDKNRSLIDKGAPNQKIRIDMADDGGVLANFDRIQHFHDSAPLSGGALNAELDWREIEEAFLSKDIPLVRIDGFLSDDGLRSMREFCLSSTIWKKDYDYGFLGSFLDRGFVSGLNLQITHELEDYMPRIFKAVALTNSVAFKHDSVIGKGLRLHADPARVGINLWTTPDDANLDPDGSGVIVYDVKKPEGWDTNNTSDEARRYLDEAGANPIVVPYRANRALLINPSLFHQTDKIKFKTGYENRRMNITFFYD